jgi:hypothetical protein
MKTSEKRELISKIFGEYNQLFIESGIQNIKKIAKQYNKAEMWFHMDLDGVATAIGMKEYLKKYNIKVVDAYPIQYGDDEFTTHKMTPGLLHVLVDFAHSKPDIRIHTDHHDNQTGVPANASKYFVKSPSNATAISDKVSPSQMFSSNDAKVIDMVDSADFAVNDITPENVMNTVFKYNKKLSVDKNSIFFGLVVNKTLLSYKNKNQFLSNVVMKSRPSLKNMYINMKSEVERLGFDISQMQAASDEYIEKSILKKETKNLYLEGTTVMVAGTTARAFNPGSYDRYTPFKMYPESDYMCIVWSMGLVQISKNPFKKAKNPYNLGEIAFNVLNKFKSKIDKEITLLDVKRIFEDKINKGKTIYAPKNTMNFQFSDFINLFGDKVNVKRNSEFAKVLQSISERDYKYLSYKQKEVLNKIKISVWDIVESSSGGHHDITNISGLVFWGKGFYDLSKEIWQAIGKEMRNRHLSTK